MSVLRDTYDLIKKLVNLAKAAENKEMSTLVIEIQEKFFYIQDEMQKLKADNRNLKNTIARMHNDEELEKDLELTEQGYYIRISEKEQGKMIMYCPACWQNHHKLMPLVSPQGHRYRCSNCKAYITDTADYSFGVYN